MAQPVFNIDIFPPFSFLLQPAPYKGLYGGRGAAKSWQVADALLLESFRAKHRILCGREYQNSIKESVHRLLVNRINAIGAASYFKVNEKAIINRYTGSDFFFKGLKTSIAEIKSTEGITRAWIEEADLVSDESWEIFDPTIRVAGSELWATWNPTEENNATDRRWRKKPPTGAVVKQVSWRDNPFFKQTSLEQKRLDMLEHDPVLYEHVWEGGYRRISESCIFNKRVTIKEFDTPENVRFYYGADFGFANDPSTLIRFFIKDECLWVDWEFFGIEVEIDDLPAAYDTVPGSRKWPIKADSARPETISYLKRKGFNISAADKWQGSVEDGITFLRGYKQIYIHPRCPNMAKESRLYSWKTDKKMKDADGNPMILPEPKDENNHGWDAIRYGIDMLIKPRRSFFDVAAN